MIAQWSCERRYTCIYISEREEDDAHSYIKRPSKNMLQEKCYKNNHDGLWHRGQGSTRHELRFSVQRKKKRSEEKLEMLDGEREVAVTLTTVSINSNNNSSNSRRIMRRKMEYRICVISTSDHYFRISRSLLRSKRSTFPASRFDVGHS